MTITVFRHSNSWSLGSLGKAIETRNIPHRVIDAFKDDFSDYDALKDDLVIILGGNCGVYQEDIYPFLTQELRILEERMKAGKHTLGICLGAQLIAKALGGKVYPGFNGPEYGWKALKLTAAGEDSIMRHLGEDVTSVLHFHGDTFDLSKEADLLASTDQYENQAFQYGDHTLGIQSHMEIDRDLLLNLEVSLGGTIHSGKLDIHKLRKNTKRYLDTLNRQADIFMNEWLDRVYG